MRFMVTIELKGVFIIWMKEILTNTLILFYFFVKFLCMEQEFDTIVENIFEKDGRYRMDAYAFVMDALLYTQKKFKCVKHVTGDEILEGMKELLLNKFGPMTMSVLRHWGIKSTEDFGNIIFNLVDSNVLSKTAEDDIDKFRNAYDFEEVFNYGYRKQLHKKISRMRSI
ncbi:MAG TPA: hypothetical protein DD723_08590 [Candidatus Omnitrophica bacterium]|nr:hypothetical protein [Candidatus Omnitrophota bacterium]